jgi:alpha-acetolactate decarboxylase
MMRAVSSWSWRAVLAAVVLAAPAPALPQQMQQRWDAAMPAVHQPYAIETFGEFRKIIQQGDFDAKVQLAAVMAKHPTTGVGAVADARGEITIYDGKLIISYGKPGTYPDANSQSAALLSVGSAGDWQTVAVDRDVAPSEIESYLAAMATAHGLDANKSFPFEIRGTLIFYLMHVNAAPTGGPHGMGLPIAIAVDTRGDQIDGLVSGLYVSPDLVGIATHGGERSHAHWVAADLSSTAHLDRWGLKAGAVLLLPKP